MSDRVKLNLRVSKSVLKAYESAILETYPQKRPYAGIELERELRAYVDEGEEAVLRQTIEECRSVLDIEQSKKEIHGISLQCGETRPIQYQIDPTIKAAVKQLADDSDYRSPGELVERVMYEYVTNGSIIERYSELLDDVLEVLDHQDSQEDLGIKSRRTKEIINNLPEREFTIDDFKQAVKNVNGISPSEYVLDTYLPLVLDELDYTTHPKTQKLFLPADDSSAPDHQDPRQKRSELIDEDDIQLGIKLTACEKAERTNQSHVTVGLTEAADLFDGNFRHDTIRRHMRAIGDSCSGYKYNTERDTLLVRHNEIEKPE